MLWKQSLLCAAVLASPIFAAPTAQRKVPQSQQLNCTPNNQGVDVCCDQFGGCIFRDDLSPEFEDRIVNKRGPTPQEPTTCSDGLCCNAAGSCFFQDRVSKREALPQAITCNDGVCCDSFGGCTLERDLDPAFRDRVVNKRTAVPQEPTTCSNGLCCNAAGSCFFQDRVSKREALPQAITCNDGVCCDSFGGCTFERDLDPAFRDRVVNKRSAEPQALNCSPNNQGVDVCCDQFGGCILRNDLSPEFEDRIVN